MKRTDLLVVAALLCARTMSYADGTGTIEGTVVDASGAVLTRGVRIDIACGAVQKRATLDAAGCK